MPNRHSKSAAEWDDNTVSPGTAIAECDHPAPVMARPLGDAATYDQPSCAWDNVTPAHAAHGPTQLRYASLGARAAAAFVDVIVLQVASMFLESISLGAVLGSLNMTTLLATTLGVVLLNGAFTLFYCVWLESSSWQATLGKRMLGLKVVDVDGRRISFGRSSLRNMAKTLSMLTLGIGYLMPLWSPRKQALHDKAAGCLVVYSTP